MKADAPANRTRTPEPAGLHREIPLAPLTTLGVGGPARYFLEAKSVPAARRALAWAESRGLPVFVLGGGSNVVVADRGFQGLVLRTAISGTRSEVSGSEARIEAGAGESWDGLVSRAVEEGWAGIECLSGIPGLVGATPIQNVGAYGQEVAETVEEVEAIDRATGELVRIPADRCGFSYRHSHFKEHPDRHLITRVRFRLRTGGPPALRYEELESAVSGNPTLGEVRKTVLRIRSSKGMVVDPEDPDSRSGGSFFLNPILSPEALARLEESLPEEREPPRYRVEGGYKVPAAWLIEEAGFPRGFRWKGVGLSSKHALALVNRGGATARQVRTLAGRIQERVRERFGVDLEPEPRFVGFDGEEPR